VRKRRKKAWGKGKSTRKNTRERGEGEGLTLFIYIGKKPGWEKKVATTHRERVKEGKREGRNNTSYKGRKEKRENWLQSAEKHIALGMQRP